jgi:hypothetical protein
MHGRHVRDGYYFVRFREPFGSGRVDYRRITLRRVHGRFRTRPSFYRHASCGLLQSYKLGRPVFGGSSNGPLTAAYRLSEAGRVTVTVRRGTRVIHRFALKRVRAHRTYRLRLAAKRLRRADYRVTLVATAGRRRVTSTLVSRRL